MTLSLHDTIIDYVQGTSKWLMVLFQEETVQLTEEASFLNDLIAVSSALNLKLD